VIISAINRLHGSLQEFSFLFDPVSLMPLQKAVKGVQIGDVAGKAYGSKLRENEGVETYWRNRVMECGS
jgi:hypothetical protein